MLVHICCSVDSHYFLQKLQKLYPDEKLIGFFYDPNIHPYSEYALRFLDVKRSCDKLKISLLEGEYDFDGWLNAVKGFEDEPEKGKRCVICFDNRLEVSAKKAKELGEKTLTTTLYMSPKKSYEQLNIAAKKIEKEFDLKVLMPDFRSGGGT
ncbi:MAG: epoxyqueuosine reductase QueH, partial [Campylobacteraceae bacterium]